MFVKSFVTSCLGAMEARRPRAVAARLAEWPARVHVLVASQPARPPAGVRAERGCVGRVRALAIVQLLRIARTAARAALRTAYAGGPLTPTGYAILALTVGAIGMVAMLSTSSVGSELEEALRVYPWFA